MARIRSIKPEFFTSEQIVECSSSARLLFIGLWCFSDDAGRHPASIRRLQLEVYPGDKLKKNDISNWVKELIEIGLLIEYESQGVAYWQVTGWDKHQKVDRPTVKYPSPFDEGSTIIRRAIVEPSPPESSRVESSRMDKNNMSADADDSGVGVDYGQLGDWLRWWNALHEEGMVPTGVNEERPSEAVRKAWKRVQRIREIRELLAQRTALENRIRKSTFCREGWFRLEKLFGAKNRDGELIVRKLLEGGYEQRKEQASNDLEAGRREQARALEELRKEHAHDL